MLGFQVAGFKLLRHNGNCFGSSGLDPDWKHSGVGMHSGKDVVGACSACMSFPDLPKGLRLSSVAICSVRRMISEHAL